MWNHNKVLQKAPEVVARHKRGESILNISFVREFPPIAVFKAFLQARDNLTKGDSTMLLLCVCVQHCVVSFKGIVAITVAPNHQRQ